MSAPVSAISQYQARFGDNPIPCSQYAISKLGIDRSRCLLKVDSYALLCAPYQVSAGQAVLVASLSKQELVFFQRYRNGLAGLSMEFRLPNAKAPLKLFVRAALSGIGPMKGRENVGLIVVDFKNTPDDFIAILAAYQESQEKLRAQFDDYAETAVKITPNVAKLMGYNNYAVCGSGSDQRRVQLYTLSSQALEHLEGAAGIEREIESELAYRLYFRKYQFSLKGTVENCQRLPSGILLTRSRIEFSPELVELLDDYWFHQRARGA